MSRVLSLVIVLPALIFIGCNKDKDTSGDGTGQTIGTPEFSLAPGIGGQGTSMDVQLVATHSVFQFGETSLDLGTGITVNAVTVEDGYNALADITIDPDATLGKRDATVKIQEDATDLTDAFDVIAASFAIDPTNGKMGETVDVAIVGQSTNWEQGYTWPDLGDDVDILDFTVMSPSLADAHVAIHADARPGPRDVSMEDGPDVVTLYDGFTVDREVITAFFDPKTGYQGDTVDFTVTGLNSNFQSGTTLEFWDDGGKNGDIEVTDLTVLDGQNMYGKMRLSNAARIGYRDVLISYGTEQILLPDAFEVLDAPPNLSDVYVGMGFYVDRAIDNATGDIAESVTGYAYFIIPLDPPCGSAPPPGSGPQPYDNNGVFPDPPPADEVDCPNPETVSAGDYVWFESPENTVTLPKYVIASTGQIIYEGIDLTLADYHFDQWYDLHTEGDPDGVPEVVLSEVQPTVPADYHLLTPQFWGDLTVDRAEDFEYTWTPAETYPDAFFITSISGTLVSTGEGGFAGSIPWDDGDHTYTAAELSQLEAGPVSFSAESYIQGVYYGLPFSIYQTCGPSNSHLATGAQMILK